MDIKFGKLKFPVRHAMKQIMRNTYNTIHDNITCQLCS